MKKLVGLYLLLLSSASFAQTKFGALLDPGQMQGANEYKIAVAKRLGISVVRDRIVLTNPKAKSLLNSGFDVFMNINYGNVQQGGGVSSPVPFPTDLDAYKKLLQGTLAAFGGKKPVVIAIENEEDNLKYHAGTAADYINELKAAIPIVHAAGIKVTNAGLTSQAVQYLVFMDYKNRGMNQEAESYRQRTNVAINAPWLQRKADFIKEVMAAYKNTDIDYINFHWYGKNEDAQALSETISYLQRVTGKPVVTNEIGQYDEAPATVKAIVQTCRKQKMPYVIWYSGLKGGGRAVPLQNEDGSLKENGQAFKETVAAQ